MPSCWINFTTHRYVDGLFYLILNYYKRPFKAGFCLGVWADFYRNSLIKSLQLHHLDLLIVWFLSTIYFLSLLSFSYLPLALANFDPSGHFSSYFSKKTSRCPSLIPGQSTQHNQHKDCIMILTFGADSSFHRQHNQSKLKPFLKCTLVTTYLGLDLVSLKNKPG